MTCEQILPATEAEDMDRVDEVIEKHMKVLSTATEKAIATPTSSQLLAMQVSLPFGKSRRIT